MTAHDGSAVARAAVGRTALARRAVLAGRAVIRAGDIRAEHIRAAVAWAVVAALLGVCALVGWWLERRSASGAAAALQRALDWQPGRVFAEPWRAWSAVAVHYSGLHLAANLAGVLLTAAFGVAAQVPLRAACAWLAAWPLTHLGLLCEPALLHYGGLSGVLHAGVAIVVVCLLVQGNRRQRQIALLVLAGCAAKLIGEAPWGPPLRHPAGWDINTAPLAHASGLLAGAVCGIVAMAWPLAARDNHRHD